MKRDPKLSEVTAIIDTREQTPFDLDPMQTKAGTTAAKITRGILFYAARYRFREAAALVASIQGLDQIGRNE